MRTKEKLEERASTRQDIAGHWHAVEAAPCEQCGCPFDYSVDEPGVIWEAGASIAEGCVDDMCECHVTPIEGLIFALHLSTRP
jgi:hypothetical protein